MARAKKKEKVEEKIDPFKTKKTSTSASGGTPFVAVDDKAVKEAIDKFAKAKIEEARIKKDLGLYRKPIENYALKLYAERQMSGIEGNFRLEGDDHTCGFVLEAKGKAITDDDLTTFTSEFGEDAAKDLIKDNHALKINGDYLEANWNRIVGALMGALTPEDFQNLFQERTKKPVPDVQVRAAKHAEDAIELQQIYSALALTTKLLK